MFNSILHPSGFPILTFLSFLNFYESDLVLIVIIALGRSQILFACNGAADRIEAVATEDEEELGASLRLMCFAARHPEKVGRLIIDEGDRNMFQSQDGNSFRASLANTNSPSPK